MTHPIRTKFAVLVLGLVCLGLGAVFASALDWTPATIAQNGSSPSTASLRTIGNAFTDIAQEVTPAVVSIRSDRRVMQRGHPVIPEELERFFRFDVPRDQQEQEEERTLSGGGSGVIVREDGYIVTNNHVVQGADRIQVVLNDGRTFDAKLVGRDPSTDVAVLKIEAGDLPVAQLAPDASVEVGEWVLAFGNPFGLDFTMTAGIVSAMGRGNLPLPRESNYMIQDFIQTDAAINPGNSGGPLVDIDGQVVGINTAIASGTGAYQGYGFAIPVSIVRNVMDQLIETGEVRRAVLGVSIQPVTPLDAEALGLGSARGVMVADFDDRVQPNPARRAGLQPRDVILAVDDRAVQTVSGLQQAVAFHDPGDTVELAVWRDGDEREVKVRLGERPSEETREFAEADAAPERGEVHESALGVEVQDVTPQVRQRIAQEVPGVQPSAIPSGVLVRDVQALSPAADARLREGYIITQIGNRPVRNLAEYREAVEDLDKGEATFVRAYDPATRTHTFLAIRVPR